MSRKSRRTNLEELFLLGEPITADWPAMPQVLLDGWPDPNRHEALVIPTNAGVMLEPWADAIGSEWQLLLPTVAEWAYSSPMGALSGSAPHWPLPSPPWDGLFALPQEREDSAEDLKAAVNAMEYRSVVVLGQVLEAHMATLDGRFEVILFPRR